MRDSDFTRLIRKAKKLAAEHNRLIAQIDIESIARHGYAPSDLDCEGIIDVVQYGGGLQMDAKEFDSEMSEAIRLNTGRDGKVRAR